MRSRIRPTLSLLLILCLSLLRVTLAQSPSRHTITGELRDDAGHPLADAAVCAIPTDGAVLRVRDKICAESDAQGKFAISLMQAGKYRVSGEKMSDGYMPAYLPFYRDPNIPIPEAVVGDENRNASLSLTLAKSGLITGKVIDEANDTPVQNFVVWIYQARTPNAQTHEVVKGSPSGRFRIFAPPVPFRLRVVSEGYEDWVMGGGMLVSAAGARKAPGSLLVRAGSAADFAVYLKKKNEATPIQPARAGDEMRLPAPVQLSPQNNEVFNYFPRNTKLSWNPVAEAVSYGVEVESCWNPPSAGGSRLPDDGECINPSPYEEKFSLNNTTYEFFFKGAQPGRWRVWAIDKDHRPGFKSAWRRFVYLK